MKIKKPTNHNLFLDPKACGLSKPKARIAPFLISILIIFILYMRGRTMPKL